jgi:glutathione S-transferase
MSNAPRFLLHHAKQTRSATAMWLLEECGAPFEVRRHDITAPRSAEHLAANPYGKFPTLVDRGPDATWTSAVTENAAIAMHVADMVPESGLAPKPSDRDRGPWVTWCTLLPAALEPGLMDLAFPRQKDPPRRVIGWPPFAETVERITNGVRGKHYLVCDRFTAADVVIGSALAYFKRIGKLPLNEVLDGYLERLQERPALKKAREND